MNVICCEKNLKIDLPQTSAQLVHYPDLRYVLVCRFLNTVFYVCLPICILFLTRYITYAITAPLDRRQKRLSFVRLF